jgi:hypothetical protein
MHVYVCEYAYMYTYIHIYIYIYIHINIYTTIHTKNTSYLLITIQEYACIHIRICVYVLCKKRIIPYPRSRSGSRLFIYTLMYACSGTRGACMHTYVCYINRTTHVMKNTKRCSLFKYRYNCMYVCYIYLYSYV